MKKFPPRILAVAALCAAAPLAHAANVTVVGQLTVVSNAVRILQGTNSPVVISAAPAGDFQRSATVGAVTTTNRIWDSGNDGTGSTLDADLLDGMNASTFVVAGQASSISNTMIANGAISGAKLAANAVTGSAIQDGTIAAADVNPATFSNTFWKTDGNAGTTTNHFIGTTDNRPFEVRVNNQRVFRVEPTSLGPNIAGGWENAVGAGVLDSFVGGGSYHMIGSNNWSSAIVGGGGNKIEANGNRAFIGGGSENTIASNVQISVIAGGHGNRVGASFASVVGGMRNSIGAGGIGSFIGGGNDNTVASNAQTAVIGGGARNLIAAGTVGATVGGGSGNLIDTDAAQSTIAGGDANGIGANSQGAVVGGGTSNTVGPVAFNAVIPGGSLNYINASAHNALAAGNRARAMHSGSFIWADVRNEDFSTTAANQFAIRAAGGIVTGPQSTNLWSIGGIKFVTNRNVKTIVPWIQGCGVYDTASNILWIAMGPTANHWRGTSFGIVP